MNKLRSIIVIIFSNSYYVYACKRSTKKYNEGQIIRHNLGFGDLLDISTDIESEIETENLMEENWFTACQIITTKI